MPTVARSVFMTRWCNFEIYIISELVQLPKLYKSPKLYRISETPREIGNSRAVSRNNNGVHARLCASGVYAMGISGLHSVFYLDYYFRRAFQLEFKID